MSVFDATRICARWSPPPADSSAWLIAPPPTPRPKPVRAPVRYSWWSLVRNPHALLVTGMVGAALARDAIRAAATA